MNEGMRWIAEAAKKRNLVDELEAAKTHFVGYKNKIENMREVVDAYKVESDVAATELTGIATQAADLIKQLEKKRKEYIAEPDKFVRSLNAFVKIYRDILQDMVKSAKQKIGDYQYKVELDRRKKEKAAERARAELQKKLDDEAAAAGIEAPQMPAQVIPEKVEPIRTSSGSASMQTKWDYEVIDKDKVPRIYLMVDDAAVKNAIKAGIREIPGLNIKEVPKVVLRTI